MTPCVLLIFKHGVNYTIIWWTAANLEDRLAVATLSEFSQKVVVSRGCPQKYVLSPPLRFLVDYFIASFNGGEIHTQGDEDGICLLAVRKFPNTVSWLIQWAFHTVEIWCDKVGLSINPDMIELAVFTRRKRPGFFEPHFFGVTLHYSMLVKYPRVVLDSLLTWRVHMDVRIRKAHSLLWTCRRACGVMWRLSPKVVHWFYISIIRPSITFAPLVWWLDCQMASAMKRLSGVQRFACLGTTGVMCTTSTSAMEALTCLPPTEVGSSEWGKVSCASSLESGMLVLPSPQLRTYWCGFSSQIPYFIWGSMLWGQHLILNPNIGLLCGLESNDHKTCNSSYS